MYDRLLMIASSVKVAAAGLEVESTILWTKETASKLSNALQELLGTMKAVQSKATFFDMPDGMLKSFEDSIASFVPLIESLDAILAHVRLSAFYILLDGEPF